MYLKKITIKNYKCFEDEAIEFNTPDGNIGSGLNILVGENNSGKTSLLSILTKLRKDSVMYSLEKRKGNNVNIEIIDNKDMKKIIKNKDNSSNIVIEGDSTLTYDHIEIIKDNKFWPGNANTQRFTYPTYKSIYKFDRNSQDDSFPSALVNVVDHDDIKNKFDEKLKMIFPDFREWNTGADDPNSGTYIKYKVSDSEFVKIDESVGSGILSVFRMVYPIIQDDQDKIIIIDEPESFLHPIAQQNLLKILQEESKSRQIIFTTHSPFMFRGINTNSRFISFIHDKSTGVTKTSIINKFLLPNGPTFGEINYHIYNLPTVEFHNELFGFIQAKAIKIDDKNEREPEFDKFLKNRGMPIDVNWTREKVTGDITYKVTLSTFIRNKIHHPENTKNRAYFDSELEKSIKDLINILKVL